jgi:hypothetical protein
MIEAIIGGLIAGGVVSAGLFLLYQRAKAQLVSALWLYFKAQGDKPSEFSKSCDILVDRAVSRFTSIAGGLISGETRRYGAIERAATKAAFPLATLIGKKSPELGDLFRNPEIAAAGENMLQGMAQKFINRESRPPNNGQGPWVGPADTSNI